MKKKFILLTFFVFSLISIENSNARLCRDMRAEISGWMSFNGVFHCPTWPDSCTYFLTNGPGYLGFGQACTSCITGASSYGIGTVWNGCEADLSVKKSSSSLEKPVPACGSIIYTGNQVVGETIPITGSSFNLYYFSNRVKGRLGDYKINIPITAETVLSDVTGYNLVIKNDVGSTIYSTSFGASTNQTTTYTSNGLNSLGQEPWATVKYKVEIEEVAPTFAWTSEDVVQIGNLKIKKLGLGGWVPSVWYFYDPSSKILYKPDGTERVIDAKTLTGGYYQVPEEDGSLVYIFDSAGKIVETKLGLTGQVIYSFYYDGSGRLSYINEPFSKTTTFNRNGSGVLTSIGAPNGKNSTVTMDANGYLATLTNPNSEVYEMTYDGAGGLLLSFEKPNGALSEFVYDGNGNLIKDEHSGGKEINISKIINLDGTFVVSSETGMNREDNMTVTSTSDLSKQETLKADGSKYISQYNSNSMSQVDSHNGESITKSYALDSVRFPNLVKLLSSDYQLRFGTKYTFYTNTITLNDPDNPFDIDTWVKTSTVGSYPVTSTYDGTSKTTTTSTYLGKTTEVEIDSYQRPVNIQQGNLNAVAITYTNDNLTQITQGTRDTTFTYNSTSKLLETITNELSQTTAYTYNSAERLTKVTLPDTREINYVYDSRGNLTSITPPSKPAHTMTIGSKELIASYNPPTLMGVPTVNTTYTYNLDNQLTEITRPDGQSIEYHYGATTGRLDKITVPAGDYEYTYGLLDSNVSLPSKIEAPNGFSVDLGYIYGVPNSVTVKDATPATVYGYYPSSSQHALLTNEYLMAGANYFSTNYTYDDDLYLSQAGDIVLTYNIPNGQLATSALGDVADTWDYNAYGELEEYEAKYSGTTVYKEEFTRDGIGRVSQKIENLNGVTSTYDYTYDSSGRLTQVDKNSTTIGTYSYDSNSNRNGGNNGTAITATYDNQDRMTAYKNHTYTYNANGDLTSKTYTPTSATTTYTYDVFGNLTQVVLPSKTITYEIDPLNRRMGRSDGTTSVRYAHDTNGRLIAEIDATTGDLTRRYVYGTKAHVPDYFVDQSNEKFRMITDHLGSVRLVIKESDGAVMQVMNHDEFGRIVTDTNPGYQPFGFAGGIWDHETGLVRFGARDYDVMSGRWTSKDPIRFEAGDTNLFGYVFNDPVNFIDPSGLVCTYSQSSGRLKCTKSDGTVYLDTTGFAGNGAGRNNSSMQDVVNVGPIPKGTYTVGPSENRSTTGPGSRQLIPDSSTRSSFPDGRNPDSFFLHGGSVSQGCPIINNPGGRASIPEGEQFIVGP